MSTKTWTNEEIARCIDHTQLSATVSQADLVKICNEAILHRFASVCVMPTHIKMVANLLKESDVKAITVISFPTGTDPTSQKVLEASEVLQAGAQELDLVINGELLKQKAYQQVYDDIHQVVLVAKKFKPSQQGPILVKVIIETGLLTHDEKIAACTLSVAAGADFVKTSTGVVTTGATPQDIKLIRETVGPSVGVKASGGIRNYDQAIQMLEAGANRIGTSAGVAIVGAPSKTGLKTAPEANGGY